MSYKYENITEVEGEVIELSNTNDGKKIILRKSNKKYIIYDYNDLEIKIGDIIKVKGITLKAETARTKNGFDYKRYLKNARIFGTMLSDETRVIKHRFNIRIIKKYFLDYLEYNFSSESYIFLKAMIIGDLSDIDEDFKEAIMNNGILHLFAVSGLHIVLFVGLVEKTLQFFNLKQKNIDVINSLFLILYLVITSFSPSVLRASLMYYISLINKQLKLGLSTLDIVAWIFIILIVYNPLYYYNLGFNLSFISSTIIILVGDFFQNYNKYIQVFIMSCFANLVTFPLVINLNGNINLLSPLTNVIFIELVEVIILPLSFFVLVFPVFRKLYDYIILAFNKITLVFSKILIIDLRFPYLNNIKTILYFLLLFGLIRVYKFRKIRYCLITGIVTGLFVFSNASYIIPKTEIHFLDLYNGEASLIIDSNNQCYALIDTGDGKNKEVTNYLKREGIKSLDYLIITHNHLDHNGEIDQIIGEINVNNLVISAYDNSVTNNSLKSRGRFVNIIKVKAGDEVKCGKNTFYILHPDKDYNDTNDDSIVIYSKIGDLHFLFLGDVTKSIEEELANYNLEVDVIKIAHHGSSTSTSAFLIDKLRPDYAIIMAGRVEKFAFPHQPTLDVLNRYNVKVYRTDINYSIIYKYKNKKGIFTTIK